jgi:hypothetical protein
MLTAMRISGLCAACALFSAASGLGAPLAVAQTVPIGALSKPASKPEASRRIDDAEIVNGADGTFIFRIGAAGTIGSSQGCNTGSNPVGSANKSSRYTLTQRLVRILYRKLRQDFGLDMPRVTSDTVHEIYSVQARGGYRMAY